MNHPHRSKRPKWRLAPVDPTPDIMDILDDPETPFLTRRNKMNPPGKEYEVVHLDYPDWRDVVSDEQKIVSRLPTQQEADELCADLAAKWRWAQIVATLAPLPLQRLPEGD